MGKVIKVIDLLNMIANGEEPPEKIRIVGHRYKYNKETKDYDSDIGMANENLFLNMGIFKELNTEIIVLDEEDEIDIQKINEEDLIIMSVIEQRENCINTKSTINKKIMKTINNLIDEIERLKKLESNK